MWEVKGVRATPAGPETRSNQERRPIRRSTPNGIRTRAATLKGWPQLSGRLFIITDQKLFWR